MSRWLDYINWDNRINKMSILWVFAISEWARSNAFDKEPMKILDYGCSCFYIGESLAPYFQEVHGYDVDPEALKKAASRQIPNAFFHKGPETIPDKNFDIIIVSSVIQYFESLEELDRFFYFAARTLKPSNQSRLVISDIIPKNYVPWKDALDNLLVAARHSILLPMLSHLYRAAFSPNSIKLLKIDKAEISKVAEKNGFRTTFMDKNLTLSKRRYTCIFTFA